MYRHPPVFVLFDYISESVNQNFLTVGHNELMELVADHIKSAAA